MRLCLYLMITAIVTYIIILVLFISHFNDFYFTFTASQGAGSLSSAMEKTQSIKCRPVAFDLGPRNLLTCVYCSSYS